MALKRNQSQPISRRRQRAIFTVGAAVPDFEFIDFTANATLAEFRGRASYSTFGLVVQPVPRRHPRIEECLSETPPQGFEIIGLNSEAIARKMSDAVPEVRRGQAREIVGTRGVNWPQSVNATSLRSRRDLDRKSAGEVPGRSGRRLVARSVKFELRPRLEGLLET
jgi:hypothetical protein